MYTIELANPVSDDKTMTIFDYVDKIVNNELDNEQFLEAGITSIRTVCDIGRVLLDRNIKTKKDALYSIIGIMIGRNYFKIS